MHQQNKKTNNYPRRLCGRRRRAKLTDCLLLLVLTVHSIPAQDKSIVVYKDINTATSPKLPTQQQTTPQKRPITISDAVSIFLQQNLQLVAARYDIDITDAEKLTARLRPNPALTIGVTNLPVDLSGPFIKEQTFSYGISQTFQLGGKPRKRLAAANANSDLARGQFQAVV